jgi:hypothetical protein
LIREMAADNPTWGQERVANELQLKLGIRVSPRTVAKYLRRGGPGRPPAPKQRWLTFVHNHAKVIVACDFFVVMTAAFRTLYVFVLMEVGSRRILHHNATAHPTAEWTLQQFRETLPGPSVPIRAPRPGQHLFPGIGQGGHQARSQGSPHAGAGADGECLLRTSRW